MSARTQHALAEIASLPAISLADLQAEAAFLTRADRKYLLPAAEIPDLLAGIAGPVRTLEIDGRREFGYTTPYFDDDAMTAFLRAARCRPDRFKVRTRLYTDSGLCHLEVKVRDARGRTVKTRIDHDPARLRDLSGVDREWLLDVAQVAPAAAHLRHCLTTHYVRFTLVLPDGAGRVTVDRNLSFALPTGSGVSVTSLAIVETKGPGQPTTVDRVLWRLGHRPLSLSKFAVGMSLLRPDLPANRWHRTRNRLDRAAEDVWIGDESDAGVPNRATILPFPVRWRGAEYLPSLVEGRGL